MSHKQFAKNIEKTQEEIKDTDVDRSGTHLPNDHIKVTTKL